MVTVLIAVGLLAVLIIALMVDDRRRRGVREANLQSRSFPRRSPGGSRRTTGPGSQGASPIQGGTSLFQQSRRWRCWRYLILQHRRRHRIREAISGK